MHSDFGETSLNILISEMNPILNDGDFVFVSVQDSSIVAREHVICEMKEKEGITLVLNKDIAEKHGFVYEYISAWITLNIHSSLAAIGLTAKFSKELSDHNISCNVIAGFYHDHIFVDKKDAANAIKVLKKLAFKNMMKK